MTVHNTNEGILEDHSEWGLVGEDSEIKNTDEIEKDSRLLWMVLTDACWS